MPTVSLRCRDLVFAATATVRFHSGAILVSCCLDDAAFAAALQQTRALDWALYGDDGEELVRVPGQPIDGDLGWPESPHIKVLQRLYVSDVGTVAPLTATVYT